MKTHRRTDARPLAGLGHAPDLLARRPLPAEHRRITFVTRTQLAKELRPLLGQNDMPTDT